MTARWETILLRPTAFIILSSALVLVLSGTAPAAEPPGPGPDFSLEDLDGSTVSLSALRGRNTLLLFGTTWCPHCNAALGVLEKFSESLGDDLNILFIAVGQNADEIADFFDDDIPPYSILADPSRSVSGDYNIVRIPTCVFIDEQGLIQYFGQLNERTIWRLLSGERPIYPDKPYSGLRASDRLAQRPRPASPRTKRFIVELDEHPEFWKKLSKGARKSRGAQFRKAAQRIGGRIIHNYARWKNKIVVEIPPDKKERLRELPHFKSFREDRLVHALLEDSAYQIKADYAWDNAITGQGVNVCVVDTGIDYMHPDLLNKVIAQFSYAPDTDDAMDDNGHGTHVAGIIASEGMRYRGVSYDVALMAAKVLDYSGSGYASDVILGINWCVEQGADVINLSLGEGLYSGTCDQTDMAEAVNDAVDAGVVVVCASGNDGIIGQMVSPSCASKAIAVGAVDKLDAITSYSDGGPELDLVAPGGEQLGGTSFPEIVSAYSTEVANDPLYCMYLIAEMCYDNYFVVEGTRYIRAIGTSMAAPHVAGAAALLLEANSHLTPSQVKTALEENADDLGLPGWDETYGWGRINIKEALDNIPAQPAELTVKITEPNATDNFTVAQQFDLAAEVDCFGGDGCGEVLVHAQFCNGYDCNDFVDINSATAISTLDNNPNEVGILSGYTLETDAPVIFDAETTLDISQSAYVKSVNPNSSLVGSTLPGQYNTGDLEPRNGIGAMGGYAWEIYDFNIPAGVVKTLKIRMENYLVMHFDYPPFAGWYIYTSNAAGDELHLVGDCIPAEGGGGETPPPDCWWVSDDPDVLADLNNQGGTSYIKLASHDVGENDWITFNDIEVIVEYEVDPNNDEINKYYVKFDLNGIDPSQECTDARLKFNIAQAAENSVAEVYLVDNTLIETDPAQDLHEANAPGYSSLPNPIKSFSGGNTGVISLNVKAAVEEALLAGRNTIAFQISEHNNDQLITIDAQNSQNPPVLTISQKVQAGAGGQPGGEPVDDPNNGPRPLSYDTRVVKDVNDDTYVKYDHPGSALIGGEFASEYNTGDLEPNDGIGPSVEGAGKLYEFEIPAGVVKTLKIRMENYFVMHFDYPPFAGWYIYTSNAAGDELHLVGDCIPAEGGGGEAPSPDCWWISDDPDVLADLNSGGIRHIKLVSHDVGDNDWITFNDIEVIVEYEVDPDNDNISRYYVKFDISEFPSDVQVDSATFNLFVSVPNDDALAQVSLVNGTYEADTNAYTIYDAEDAHYTSSANPIKSFACDTYGLKKVNVKSALEDAIESNIEQIAFLITEHNEDALFTISAGGAWNQPRLDVYLKSDISGARAGWTLLPNDNGDFTLRILAANNVGVTGLSDAMVVNIYDPNLPVINSVDCMLNSVWQDCTKAQYGDNLQKIRIDATDPQETPDVRLVLRNIPDDHNFVDEQLTYSSGYFTHDTNLEITDSGQWQIRVTSTDSQDNTDTETITWNIPWGKLTSRLLSPTTNITVPKSGSFLVQTSVQCLDAECPQAKASIRLNEPTEIKYDDTTAESYGDIGSTDWYLAVSFKPDEYPAQLKTARFYIWDTTTYPFELRVWDDNGSGGTPGTMLISPLAVDPVVPSGVDPNDPSVAWFDIDLSSHNIIINSGYFYIGWRQLEGTKNNQVGFDMDEPFNGQSWAYALNPFTFQVEWFNLDSLCEWCDSIPELCEYCGNLMIRAITEKPDSFSGQLPQTANSAAFYTLDDHPKPCQNPQMDPGETCEATFQVYAVGAVAEKASLYAVAANNYSFDMDDPVNVTITSPLSPCHAANLDAVGPVNFDDFALLLQQWLQTTPPLSADIYIDQSVDALDLAEIAEHWLESCE